MRPPDYRYSGTFLSELAATGRATLTVRCGPCGHERALALVDIMAEHGDVVLPHVLSLVTVEEAAIKAGQLRR